jgi:hypothetical protein
VRRRHLRAGAGRRVHSARWSRPRARLDNGSCCHRFTCGTGNLRAARPLTTSPTISFRGSAPSWHCLGPRHVPRPRVETPRHGAPVNRFYFRRPYRYFRRHTGAGEGEPSPRAADAKTCAAAPNLGFEPFRPPMAAHLRYKSPKRAAFCGNHCGLLNNTVPLANLRCISTAVQHHSDLSTCKKD